MDARRYALALSPEQALEALQAGLATRDVVNRGTDIHVDVVETADGLVLHGHGLKFTARIGIELVATDRGATVELRRVPPRLHGVAEFRPMVAVGLWSAFVIGTISPSVAVVVLLVHSLLVGSIWLVQRRRVAAVNDALVSLVWSVWAPALQERSPGMYRRLASSA